MLVLNNKFKNTQTRMGRIPPTLCSDFSRVDRSDSTTQRAGIGPCMRKILDNTVNPSRRIRSDQQVKTQNQRVIRTDDRLDPTIVFFSSRISLVALL